MRDGIDVLEKKYRGNISEYYTVKSAKTNKVSRKKIQNSKDTLLTVLVTAYNHESTIKKCIESILEQDTKYKFEIWVLEDCSTDSTLDICKKYAAANPETIKLVSQSVNTKGYHASFVRRNVTSNYLSIIEADDWWCNKDKIQTALDVLENNQEYVTFAHDTLYINHNDGTNKSLVHDILKLKIKNPVQLENAPYLHTSSRIHRNVIHPQIRGDIIIHYSYLNEGPLYYYDKIMSVYNITGKGSWSGLSKRQQALRYNKSQYRLNRMLQYKYDNHFTEKVSNSRALKSYKRLLGKRLGWGVYILNERIISQYEKN